MFIIGLAYFNFQFCFRLATFIAGYELFQIEVNKTYGISSWRSDLKKVWFSSTQNYDYYNYNYNYCGSLKSVIRNRAGLSDAYLNLI
jgi:hypothetical protein